MMRQLLILLGFSMAMIAGRSAFAGDCEGCEVCCPSCGDHVCELKLDESGDKKHCWNIEYKPICIPKVTFPWQKGCGSDCGKGGKGCCITPLNGAKMKYVKVLVKHEYECKSCKYKFTPVPCGKWDDKGGDYKPAAGVDSPQDVPADPPEVRGIYGTPVTPVVSIEDSFAR